MFAHAERRRIVFDSPIEHCPVCGHFVVLDQARSECARRQHCSTEVCPLQRYFTEVDLDLELGPVAASAQQASCP
jgi:hypothetical protein